MKFTGTDKLRERALYFEKEGMYTKFPKGSIPHREFWEEEDYRCKFGFEAGGTKITGPHYFYLNYVNILSKNEETGRKTRNFPRFLDIDYDFFHIVERARREKKGVILVKPRRTGFSYKNAALVSHEYNFYKDSNCIIGSFLSKLGETTMGMVLENLNFLNSETEWIKPRNPDTRSFVKSRHLVDIDGVKVWKGYNSVIEQITFKDNPFASIGRTASLFLWEEAGKFENLIESYNISEPCWKDGEDMTGIPIIYGTGGDMEGGTRDFHEMFYNPEKYGLLAFNNEWDPGKQDKKCGWFLPATRGRLGSIQIGKTEFETKELVDRDGNSNEKLAQDTILKLRELKNQGKDSKAVRDAITQYPLIPQEAFLRSKGSVFPSAELQEHLSNIETSKELQGKGQKIELYFDANNKLQWKLNSDLQPILDYPLKKDDGKDGCIIIWEHPEFVGENNPYGLYIAGCLTPGEKVMTDKGLMNVEDVTLQNKLINKEGELVTIKNLQRRDKVDHDIFKFKLSNTYRTTTFTKGHPIYVSKTGYNNDNTINEDYFDFSFVRADKIEVGNWTKYPNVYLKENSFDISTIWKDYNTGIKKIENPLIKEEFYWFIGLWLGDGCCYNNTICVSFNLKEEYYIEKYINIIL